MTIDTKALRALAEAATPGPWYVQYGDDASHMCMTAISTRNKRLNNQGCFTESEFESLIAITLHQSYPWVDPDCKNDDANSNYIAACSPDVVLALLDALERKDNLLREQLTICKYLSRSICMTDETGADTNPDNIVDSSIEAITKEIGT